MAERRPVTALEIRRDVEGYSGMNEDAFARRFYADRAELSDLGIQLTIDKPIDGVAEQENYSLRPENFHLAKIETAIFRNKTITFEYHTMESDEVGARKVDPYHLLYQGGQFYLLGHSHERGALRVFRLSRMRGKVAYASKAEHDFKRPAGFDPRAYANRAEWQYGEPAGEAQIWVSDRIAWLVERHFGRHGEITPADGGVLFTTLYASARQMAAWALSLGEHVRIEGPPELVDEIAERVALLGERHAGEPQLADEVPRADAADEPPPEPERRSS